MGHFLPLVPLAWSFMTMGDEVIVTIADYADSAERSGFEVVNVAPDFSMAAVNERLAREYPEFPQTVATRPAINLEEWAPVLAGVNRPMIDGIMAVTDDWHPDLVLYDQGTTAGLLASARAGVPAVQRNMSAWRTRGMHEAIAAHLTEYLDKYQLTLPKPAVTVESFPPSMLADLYIEGWPMRWVPYAGGAVLGDRLMKRPERPRVAITMGTIEMQTFGVDSLKPIITAAAEVDAEFVLAAGGIDISPLGELPPNVRALDWVPLHALLQTCTAIVHHGGGGTALTAIDAGLPQLVTPDAHDQFQHTTLNAVRMRGIGLVSERSAVDSGLLKRLISDEEIRAATAQVREEMRALPAPAAVAQRIVRELF
jgi:hypothetical protein